MQLCFLSPVFVCAESSQASCNIPELKPRLKNWQDGGQLRCGNGTIHTFLKVSSHSLRSSLTTKNTGNGPITSLLRHVAGLLIRQNPDPSQAPERFRYKWLAVDGWEYDTIVHQIFRLLAIASRFLVARGLSLSAVLPNCFAFDGNAHRMDNGISSYSSSSQPVSEVTIFAELVQLIYPFVLLLIYRHVTHNINLI